MEEDKLQNTRLPPGATEIYFNFLDCFNEKKGISKPMSFRISQDVAQIEKMKKFMKWIDSNGAKHQKVQYPAIFNNRGCEYYGVYATEDIGENEVKINQIIAEIPSNLILSTRTAFNSELKPIFLNNPSVFALSHNENWES